MEDGTSQDSQPQLPQANVSQTVQVQRRTPVGLQVLLWLIVFWMLPSRLFSSLFAVTTSNQTIETFSSHYNWEPPKGFQESIDYFTGVAVAITIALSVAKRFKEFRDLITQPALFVQDHPPAQPSQLSLCAKLTLAITALGVLANAASTALNTSYGAINTMNDLLGDSGNSTVPSSANSTMLAQSIMTSLDINRHDLLSDSMPTSQYSLGIFAAGIIIALGAGALSGTYNYLSIRNDGQQERCAELRSACDIPNTLYWSIMLVNLLTGLLSTMYGAISAENQLGSDGTTTSAISMNAVLAILVAINNWAAQRGSLKKGLARLQPPYQVAPDSNEQVRLETTPANNNQDEESQDVSQNQPRERGLVAAGCSYTLRGILAVAIAGGNLTQSLSNIGQVAAMARYLGISESVAFYLGTVGGGIAGMMGCVSYGFFRGIPAYDQGRNLIENGIDKFSGCYEEASRRVRLLHAGGLRQDGKSAHIQLVRVNSGDGLDNPEEQAEVTSLSEFLDPQAQQEAKDSSNHEALPEDKVSDHLRLGTVDTPRTRRPFEPVGSTVLAPQVGTYMPPSFRPSAQGAVNNRWHLTRARTREWLAASAAVWHGYSQVNSTSGQVSTSGTGEVLESIPVPSRQ
ncbi:MAG: hypothetical protein K0R66_561 [Gammaproteobacteria bacterium]|jgi:hypothetical protein|nr:hypothetical protein [Gammaproteobacteria bacterium]